MVRVPWAMGMKAVSIEEPGQLMQALTSAVVGCGGWVLSQGVNDSGTVNVWFEFERKNCVNIYSELIAVGIELGQNGHFLLTELCQCTLNLKRNWSTDLASIKLEVQTYPDVIEEGLRNSMAAAKRTAARKVTG